MRTDTRSKLFSTMTGLMFLLLVVFTAGCDRDHGTATTTSSDTTAPTVSLTSPENAALDVPINRKVTIGFSESMNSQSITTANISMKQTVSGANVAGTVTPNGTSAIFAPTGNLAANTQYTVTISTGAKDQAGNGLASAYVFSFTTSAAADTTAPTVSVVSPTSTAVDVPINRIVTLGFSEDMDPLTITSASLTMKETVGGTSVAGTVASNGTSATFDPSSNLANNTNYTVTLSTGAKDLAGNAMASSFVSTFTTGATADTTAPSVSLVSPTDGAVEVPINRTVTIGFSEEMDPLTITSASISIKETVSNANVVGTVTPNGTSATFVPLSNFALNTKYTISVTTGAKDTAGNALAGNVAFTFTTSAAVLAPTVTSTVPSNGDTGVQINRRITATFTEEMDDTTLISPATTFTVKELVSGTSVTGTVTYAGETAVFTPTSALTGSTEYTATITTVAKSAAGISMAANYVWSFNSGLSADTTAPTLISSGATSGDIGLPINRDATATFSEPMDATTLVSPAVSFTLKEFVSGNPVAGSVSYLGNTATFNPTSDLLPSTKYECEITTGAKDLAGNALTSGLRANPWSWTTSAAADILAPTITVTNPADLATNVPVSQAINATFSEAMDLATMITTNYTVKETVSLINVPGTVSYDTQNNIMTFTSQTYLTADTDYTVEVSAGAKDQAGNLLVVPAGVGLPPNPWTFRTAPASVGVVPLAIDLGAATTFGIAANAAMTSSGVTQVNGDIALAPFANTPSCADATGTLANCLVATIPADATGLNVNGTIYWDDGTANSQSATALAVLSDLNTAFVAGMARPTAIASGYLAGEIGGKTVYPGVYPEGSTLLCSGNLGTTTLDALNDANAIFIFQVGSSITASASCNIQLANGAQARNVWFLANASATIGTGSTWNGNVLAGVSVSVLANSTVNGRLLAGALGAGVFSMTTTATGPASITINVPQ